MNIEYMYPNITWYSINVYRFNVFIRSFNKRSNEVDEPSLQLGLQTSVCLYNLIIMYLASRAMSNLRFHMKYHILVSWNGTSFKFYRIVRFIKNRVSIPRKSKRTSADKAASVFKVQPGSHLQRTCPETHWEQFIQCSEGNWKTQDYKQDGL